MKNIFGVLLILIITNIDVNSQVYQTKTINAANTGVTKEYEWGNGQLCKGTNYRKQNGAYKKAGWKSQGETSLCITETSHRLRSVFKHPEFTNSQISEITFSFDVKIGDQSGFTSIPFELILPSSNCYWQNNNEKLFNCLNCTFPNNCTLLANNVSASQFWTKQTVTIKKNYKEFSAFAANSTETVIAFNCSSNIIDFKSIKCVVTYQCDPATPPNSLSASAISASEIKLNWNPVVGASSYKVYDCSGNFMTTTTVNNYTIKTGLYSGKNYSYKVKAVNDCAPSSNYSSCATTTTFLNTPELMTNANSNSMIQLAWNPVVGASSYKVYDCSGNFIKTTTGTSHLITGLSNGTGYSYKVKAIGSTSNSDFSVCKSAVTFPAVPVNLKAMAVSSSAINLNWNAVKGANSYSIYNCSGSLIKNTGSNQYSVNGLSSLTDYYYKVKANNGSGSSNYSICVNTTTLIPEPSNFVVSASSNSTINLSWNSVPGATNYHIYDCAGGLIKDLPGTSSSYTFSGLLSGTRYGYSIKTVGDLGTSAYTECKTGLTLPNAPLDLVAKPTSSSSILLKWNTVKGASSYDIYTCSGIKIGDASSDRHYYVKGLSAQTNYSYKIVAKNASGSSEYTSCVNVTTLLPEPDNFKVIATSTRTIKLSWNDVAGAISYDIYNCSGMLIKNLSSNNHSITGLLDGSGHAFKIRSNFNSGSSQFTTCESAVTHVDSPSGFNIISNMNKPEVKLSWNRVDGATIYRIRSYPDHTPIATLDGDITQYVISNLTHNTSYAYEIGAFNSVGKGWFSADIGGKTVLPAITNLKASLHDYNVKYTWNSVADIQHYEIIDCITNTVIAKPTTPYYVLKELKPSTSIHIKVRGILSDNVTVFSNCVTQFLPIETPQITDISDFKVTRFNKALRIQWNYVFDANLYEVYLCDGTYLGQTSKNNFVYLSSSLLVGQGVNFKIKAKNSNNPTGSKESFYSDCSLGFIMPPCSPNINISNQDINSNKSNKLHKSSGSITIKNTRIHSNYGMAAESETKVLMKLGFKAETGSFFTANIVDCETSNFRIASQNELEAEHVEDIQVIDNITLNIYPNPTNGRFNIELTNVEQAALIEVYDVVGKQVFSQNNVDNILSIDLKDETKGIYFVRVTVGNDVFNEKVVYN